MHHRSSSGKVSPESIRSKASLSETSEDSHDPCGMKPSSSPGRKEELSLYKKTKRAITSKKYGLKHDPEAITPIELISRGPDGRFVIDPTDMEMSIKPRRIEGFPFVEESDLYPEFRQSDEENDDPRPLPPAMATLRPHQISPISSQESYLQPPAYSPRFHRPYEGMTIMESSRLQATGQIRGSLHHHRAFYGYLGPPGDHEPPPPFYMPDTSPLSSVISSPPYLAEGPFGHHMIPEEMGEGSPEIVVRPRPRPNFVQPAIPPEMTEITLLPPSTASFSRRSSPSSSPALGQGGRRASPSYRSHLAFATSAASYPASQSPSPPLESSIIFGPLSSQRRTDGEILPSESSPPQLSNSGKRRGAMSALSGSERMDALIYQRMKKAKKMTMNNNNSKLRKKTGVSTSQTHQAYTSQVLQPEEALYLRKKKKRPLLSDPYTRFSALLYRRPQHEDQKSILACMDHIDPDHAALL
uniref:Uncharacterized protein n=1 Tax=Knipowitschia caucasica TaxID=637954 RepID=A0AAV2J9C2_KNICA